MSTIRAEISLINEFMDARVAEQVPGVIEAMKTLDSISYPECETSACQYLENWRGYREAIDCLRHHSIAFVVGRNLSRQRIMAAESHIPGDIKRRVKRHCLDLYSKLPLTPGFLTPDDWLSRFAMDVYNRCTLRTPFALSSSDYIPALQPPRVFEGRLNIYPAHTHSYHSRVATVACNIISTWFDLTCSLQDDIRAYFVGCLVSTLGLGSLLLNETWEVYEGAPQWLLDDRYRKRGQNQRQVKFQDSWMESFKSRLAKSQAADKGSAEYHGLQDLQHKYENCTTKLKVCSPNHHIPSSNILMV